MLETFFSNLTFLDEWLVDALTDSIKTIPFLFLVFLFIELFEHYLADKIKAFLKHSKKEGPILGAAAGSIPQCGFSVVASALYTEGFITKGSVIAAYIATSDEAIPVLLMYPDYISFVLPLIFIKIFVAVIVGYLVDLSFKKPLEQNVEIANTEGIEGCCSHPITKHKKRDFLIHPLKHTVSIFFFILCLTIILNYLIEVIDITKIFDLKAAKMTYISPLISAIFGLIPNCAVSVGLVLMFIKGTITFGTMISGLMTGGGLGLLVLFKNNKNKKDILSIILILIATGYFSGVVINTVHF